MLCSAGDDFPGRVITLPTEVSLQTNCIMLKWGQVEILLIFTSSEGSEIFVTKERNKSPGSEGATNRRIC